MQSDFSAHLCVVIFRAVSRKPRRATRLAPLSRGATVTQSHRVLLHMFNFTCSSSYVRNKVSQHVCRCVLQRRMSHDKVIAWQAQHFTTLSTVVVAGGRGGPFYVAGVRFVWRAQNFTLGCSGVC